MITKTIDFIILVMKSRYANFHYFLVGVRKDKTLSLSLLTPS